ncbi:hypothetical protein HYQ46_012479 [Verticillium longisporum]|nr:hypothetical protein HYQ46_012479 [Verticillium longisporum]
MTCPGAVEAEAETEERKGLKVLPTLDSAAHTGLKTERGADKGGVTPTRAARLDEARDSLRRKPKQPAPGAGL